MLASYITNSQLKVPFDNEPQIAEVFRPIHYLGSKLRILDFIESTVNELDPTFGRLYDLFSGSGVVSRKLSLTRPVTSVDIQEYSRVVCSALLNPRLSERLANTLIAECMESPFCKKLMWAIEPLAIYEDYCLQQALVNKPDALCDLLENGSIISYEIIKKKTRGSSDLFKNIEDTLHRLKSLDLLNGPGAISIRLAGGIYFSYRQSAQADMLLHAIYNLEANLRDGFLAPLLSALSNSVNTVGKQFAQPIRPRNSDGDIKSNLGLRVNKDRSIDIIQEYKRWLDKYLSVRPGPFESRALRMDYNDALDTITEDTKIVYADPPYTRDHYSRYYHTLETICLRDVPNISTMVLNGKTQISRGVYREERHQSPFCIKSQAPEAFRNLIGKCRLKNLDLIISYSPYDETKKVHPRLLKMQQLIELSKEYYKNIEIVSPGAFTHSKLNRLDKHLEASEKAEILIVCKS